MRSMVEGRQGRVPYLVCVRLGPGPSTTLRAIPLPGAGRS
jgi:hypothetical protein